MLDDETPHVAVSVQASRDGKVIAATLSDESGKYRLINLKPGRYQVRCYTLGGYLYYGEGKDKPVDISHATSLQIQRGKKTQSIDFRFAPFKKGIWKNYDTLDGLAHNAVTDIYRDPDGVMWFATEGGGVSRYDGKEFVNFTIKDGLLHNWVFAIHQDPDGVFWFGTRGGVSRYDGKEFKNFTTRDGLVHNRVYAIHCSPDGLMWFGTKGGVSCYEKPLRPDFDTGFDTVHGKAYSTQVAYSIRRRFAAGVSERPSAPSLSLRLHSPIHCVHRGKKN